MSKMGDYFEQQEKERVRAQEQREKETVADFAKELDKPADFLMKNLREAGVQKTSEKDRITEIDKQVLLNFLQKKHSSEHSNKGSSEPNLEEPRKKISLNSARESEEDKCLQAVAEQANGAEWECLELFAGNVIFGHKIEHQLQSIVNLIVAKAVFVNALPMKKLGRPKRQETEDLGKKVAQKYWDLRDSGSNYSEAVSHIADKIHKDERHIMRLVEKHKKNVGLTFEEREEFREWAAIRESAWRFIKLSPPTDFELMLRSYAQTPEFTEVDYVEYLDEQIVNAGKVAGPTVIK